MTHLTMQPRPLELIGSVNLHFRLSGPSVERTEGGEWAMSGLVIQYWYPACAAIFRDLSTPYIMSVSLLHTHVMQIRYADRPGPTVTVEEGKRFPFYHYLQVRNDNGSILYLQWQLWGGFQPKQMTNETQNCSNLLMQEDGSNLLLMGGSWTRGDSLTRVDISVRGD